jgi:3-oxoacyl-[acyl-carrier-protein] synthase II
MSSGFDIAVTGTGLTVPVGLGAEEAWRRSVRGESGIGPLRRFDPSGHACTASAEVAPFALEGLRQPKNEKFMNPGVRCAMRAAMQAWASGGIDLSTLDPRRVGLYTGAGQTGIESSEFFRAFEFDWTGDAEKDFARMGGRAARLIDRYFSLRSLANAGLGLISAELGIMGPHDNFVQADTASAQAVLSALHDLAEERVDAALVGGYDSLLYVSNFLAYARSGLLSPSEPSRAYRPFDRDRDGIVLGEGAGFLVLERSESALRRDAHVSARIVGGASGMEGGDEVEAKASTAAMRAAIGEAVGDAPVDLVVAHGIGTREGDLREARLLSELLGPDVPVTAFKSQTGYLGAASAAVELCLAVETLRHGCIPPIARHATPDPECTLDLVTGRPRPVPRPGATALCLSWSWLGQCAAIAVQAAA